MDFLNDTVYNKITITEEKHHGSLWAIHGLICFSLSNAPPPPPPLSSQCIMTYLLLYRQYSTFSDVMVRFLEQEIFSGDHGFKY